MNVFDSYTYEVLLSCIKSEVDFLIVGGYAVNFHGFRRTTGDIDLWIKPDNNNKLKVIKALELIGIESNAIKEVLKFDFDNAPRK